MPSHQPLGELSDAEVMLQAQWGSERAFAELYARHYRRLLDFFYGLSRDVQTAEDLYRHPASDFVAQFIGRTNLLTGRVLDVGPAGLELGSVHDHGREHLPLKCRFQQRADFRPNVLSPVALPSGG